MNTNKLNRRIILLLFCCMISFVSCRKFLDKKITNGITTPTQLSDLQALLDEALGLNESITPVYGEASSDDYFLNPDYKTVLDKNPLLKNVYIRRPYEYSFQNDWSKAYLEIYNANYCLDMIKAIPASTDNRNQWDNVYGSALFMRAYYFLLLTWEYAKAFDREASSRDLGIVLRLTSDFNVPSQRSSVKQCYDQIVNDVMESVGHLPDFPVHVYRPSKWAAYGLLARTYLSMRQYDSAYKYADECLKLRSDLMDFNGDKDVKPLGGKYPFSKFNKETIYYTGRSGWVVAALSAANYMFIDSGLVKSYEENDLRKTAFFSLVKGNYTFTGSYSQNATNFTGIATDEIFLIRAECAARLNNIKEALFDLNTLLASRYKSGSFLPLEILTKEGLIDRILLERRKELISRNLRWMDLKRLNKENKSIVLVRVYEGNTYTLQPNANYYALPLPTDIIKLAQIQQNDE
ncbi:RagB/SusD family nutrient uptake outer membrane protein [Niabella drilacis]|uniref:SusD family protein n=1 Tax=Niabella drilacis (strain DSM 25811 / CCM 8410 / CCUG 62505 / LMG 26954 / E90) TaxID=1285928 RepID=A0A1G6XP15_NIADE|nr:RagB/SusD family nutrient uptake outer membrane protein [Niabella drilacis]SDD79175.1 SusD family protein [Niabella drilacis]